MQEGVSTGGSRRVDGPIARLAEAQHGVVGRHQLEALGFDKSGIDTRVRRGSLLVIHQGVYAVGHGKLTQEARWMAAVLAGGAGAVLSHRSAAQLWGLLSRSGSVPEITRAKSSRRRAGIRVRQAKLRVDEIEVAEGIPVTSASRTMLDLAALVAWDRGLSPEQLERAWAEAETRHLTSALSLPRLLGRHPRHPGSGRLGTLLAAGRPAGVTRSELEERFLALIDEHGLPRPELNANLALRGRFVEVDCLWRRNGLIAELDGRAVHGTVRAFERDRERDRNLAADGWHPIRVTWAQLRDEPQAIAADLRRLLADGPG